MSDIHADDAGWQALARVAQRLNPHAHLRRAWPLHGGVSAQATALKVQLADGSVQTVVLRQHGAVDRAHNPRVAATEFRLLQLLQANGVAVPAPLLLDESGDIFPTPYLIVEYIDGQPDFAPADLDAYLRQFATYLRRIHAIHALDAATHDLSFLPPQATHYAALIDQHSTDEGALIQRARDLLRAVWPLPPRNAPTLLHGDYWPGNVLCRAGHIVAVIDWEDAAMGDPLADLANARLETLWAFGADALQRFTAYYLDSSAPDLDTRDLPYWELCAALRAASTMGAWAADADAPLPSMRDGLTWFVEQALGSRPPPQPSP